MLQEFDSDKNIDTEKILTRSLNQTPFPKMKDDNKVAKSVEMTRIDSKITSMAHIDISQDLAKDPNTQSFVSTNQQVDAKKSEQKSTSNIGVKSNTGSDKFIAKDFLKKYYDDIVNMT